MSDGGRKVSRLTRVAFRVKGVVEKSPQALLLAWGPGGSLDELRDYSKEAYKRGPVKGADAGVLELPCPKSQQVSAVDERWRTLLLEPIRDRWRARAGDRDRAGHQRDYAARRAEALGRPVGPRVGKCGTVGAMVACACPGASRFRPYGCRQWFLCARCRKERSPRLGRRIREGLLARFAEEVDAWNGKRDERPRLVLLTLTVRHSGDLAVDREALASGWRRFYKRMNRWIGVYPYAGVWEVTPSDDGHLHAHVAVVWPWLKWKDVRALWLESCPESERINMVAKRRDGKASTPSSVANYLGKYLSKGVGDFSPRLNAEVSAAMYNKRSVFTSTGFWEKFVPVCPTCDRSWHVCTTHVWRGEAWPMVDFIGPLIETPNIVWQHAFSVDTEVW